jgi:hypothetical protein
MTIIKYNNIPSIEMTFTKILLCTSLLLHLTHGAFHGNLVHPHLTHAFEAKW